MFYGDLTIIIPSRSRAGKIKTLDGWPEELAPHTYLVIYESQEEEYRKHYPDVNMMVCPDFGELSKKRQWAMENCGTKFMANFDDDMRFARRDYDNRTASGAVKLVDAAPGDIVAMIDWMVDHCVDHPYVGVSYRGGNNRHEGRTKMPGGRITGAFMCDAKFMQNNDIRWDQAPLMEDIHVGLAVLRAGFPTIMTYDWTYTQVSNAKGGCSDYRTASAQSEAAHRLALLHPGFVRVTEKQGASWVGMPNRVDVVVQWAKAYKENV